MEIKYQEHDLDGIMRYFANGFENPKGKQIVKWEFTIDTFRRIVIYKIYIDEKETK